MPARGQATSDLFDSLPAARSDVILVVGERKPPKQRLGRPGQKREEEGRPERRNAHRTRFYVVAGNLLKKYL